MKFIHVIVREGLGQSHVTGSYVILVQKTKGDKKQH